MNCRFCKLESNCNHILTLEKQPLSAQGFFDTRDKSLRTLNLEIYECSQCGLVQHNSKEVKYYKDVIRAIAYSPEMKKFRLEQLKKWVKDFGLHDKNILEIGAGEGEYLDLLNEAGAQNLFAIENSPRSIKILQKKNYNSQKGFLDSSFVNSWNISFNGIVSFNFLEHWPDLHTGLKQIKMLMSNDGVALIEVPNFTYMLENGIFSEFTVDHIYYFTEKTLRNVLQSVGLEIISIKSIWKDYILSAKVRRRKNVDISKILLNKREQSRSLVNFLSNYKGVVVVWGAGHQALSLMAMISAENYIKYVVDSAPFKQGKFCPGSGLQIFSPTQLKIDCPQCIIVMGAAYSDEIINIINNDFKNVRDVLTLDSSGLKKNND
jgi:SAM-dependent methyltransferase